MEFARPQQTTVAKADASAPQQIEPLVSVRTDEPIKPIQPAVIESAAVIELGKQLWFDPRLSK